MAEIMYNPNDVGKIINGPRGNPIRLRQYHLTPKQIVERKRKFIEITKNIPLKIKELAGSEFFNPYRNGVYFAQIQSLYLLGANKWHSLLAIRNKMKEQMSDIIIKKKDNLTGMTVEVNSWEQFKYKEPKSSPSKSKDEQGRIRENMVFLQRLTRLHPSGYKLKQVCAAVDMKRVTQLDFPNGLFFYRLSTYKTIEEAIPQRDFSEYTFAGKRGRLITNRFIGKIITADKVLVNGKVI